MDDMQAFLITAYKDEPQLRRLVRFCASFAKVYVHIDRKSSIPVSAVEGEGGIAIKKYKIGWGAYSHLLAIVALLRLALADSDVGYIHVISGQDFPLHSATWFKERYANCDEIQGYVVPVTHRSVNPHWYEHYWPSTLFGLDKRNVWVKRLDDFAEWVQSKWNVRVRRIGGFQTPFKSLVYISLPSDAARYVVRHYDSHARFRWDLRHCLIAEEFFFMTILMNSPFAEKVTKRDIHYCDWSERHGAYPAILDAGDFARIYDASGNTPFVFARKMDSQASAELIEQIGGKINFHG